MPQYPTREPSTAPRTPPGADLPTQRMRPPTESPGLVPGATETVPKAADLTVNKVIAGAGAAATSAVLGSYFGAAGTVVGAALGSVASTVTTVLYQRSLDRTRDRLVARIKVTSGRRPDVAETRVEMPAQRVAPDAETVRLHVRPALPAALSPRRPWLWAAATVLVFAIGLLAVTGLEWAKGSTLTTGETGTSVGRVFTGDGGGGRPTEDSTPADVTEAPRPSDSAEPSAEPTGEPSPSDAPERGATRTPEPTPSDQQGVPGENGGDDESGAPRTPLVPVPAVPGE